MSMLSVILITIGILLIYAAVKDQDPRKIVQDALKRKAA